MTLETGWLPTTPVDDTLIWNFLHAQADYDDAFALAAGGRVDAADGVRLADAGGPVPWMNQAVLLRPLTGPDDGVLDAVESFAPTDRPSVLLSAWPTPDLSARGWDLVGHPAMVARAPAPVPDEGRWAVAAGVEVRVAESPEDVALAERIVVEGYPVDHAVGAPVGAALPPGLPATGARIRIASVDGDPVAVGVVHVARGLVNLCLGAALPAARRRGAWSALVRARVLEDPTLPAVAYTSDDSRPGFRALGFLPITRFTMWGRGLS